MHYVDSLNGYSIYLEHGLFKAFKDRKLRYKDKNLSQLKRKIAAVTKGFAVTKTAKNVTKTVNTISDSEAFLAAGGIIEIIPSHFDYNHNQAMTGIE